MKLATFNVNGIASRLKHLLQWLEKESPDVVCLQELKAPETGLPVKAIRDAGYGALWRGQKSWNGVAIPAKGADPVVCRRERSEEHTSELQSHSDLVCRLLLEKKKKNSNTEYNDKAKIA